ncbi:Crp/Fnr family transcriptional regulator [Glaciimonas sp. PAMC28666]|uniref:Crp/Fnr family transcriptional regulator n=1 Tax=Glaciimonas sp. PAMC28666 TaxID=2807626 RepID=UPI001964D304|nr:Crp/Fnr family transcriptional regulator [Glaciimonas sp. PAMC28666]QRX81757.1 Crp/Fnr family transcriptional regulator [Glaciimonas sp. PAMC28666]
MIANKKHNAFNLSAPALATPQHQFVSIWLTDLDYDWSEIKQRGRERVAKKEEILFLEGQPTNTVYIVESGRIRLVTYSPDGKEQHLAVIGSNGLVGDCGLFSVGRHQCSAIASSEATIFEVAGDTMLQAVQRHPTVMRQYLALIDVRFRIMLQHYALLSASSATQRVCYHLLGLMHGYSSPHRGGLVIRIVFTQQEMANVCSISRVSVSNIFSMLEDQHVITREGRNIVIIDPKRLTTLAVETE